MPPCRNARRLTAERSNLGYTDMSGDPRACRNFVGQPELFLAPILVSDEILDGESAKTDNNMLWVDKHRPQSLAKLDHNPSLTRRLSGEPVPTTPPPHHQPLATIPSTLVFTLTPRFHELRGAIDAIFQMRAHDESAHSTIRLLAPLRYTILHDIFRGPRRLGRGRRPAPPPLLWPVGRR